jgi:hypothetical protein
MSYELSLWNDIIKSATQNDHTVRYFDEQKSYVLGADNMNFIGSAFNISLETDINGTNNLTFTLPMKYWDLTLQKLVDNPLFLECANEKKLKLRKQGIWYSFVIKSIQEDSSQHTAAITAVDICINELSKNGYGLTFDNELYGNDGEINELAAKIMEGSSWTYIPVNTDEPGSPKIDLTEYKEEVLYSIEKLNAAAPSEISCEKISTDANPQEGEFFTITTEDGVITNSGHLFMFYSDLISEYDEIEAIYVSDNVYQEILSPQVDYNTKVELIEKQGLYIYIPVEYIDSEQIVLSDYSVRKIVKSQKREYSDEIDQMLYAYRGPEYEFNEEYWGWTEWYVERNIDTDEYEWKFINRYYQIDLNENSLNYLKLKKDIAGTILVWTDSDGTFKPYFRGYSKIRTLNESKSNRFNLMQSISESFEVWVDYKINYSETGQILRDESDITRAQKYITFRQNNAQINNIGFTYGVNLGSISRILNSDEIATKIYVDYIDNSALENGICSIQTARENFTQENYTLNFDYYVQKKLIDANELYNDLYNLEDGYLGHFINLHNYNEKLALYTTAIIQLTTQIVMDKETLDRTQDSIKAIGGNFQDGSVDIDGPLLSTDPLAQNGTWRNKLLKIYKDDAPKVKAITYPISTTVKRLNSVLVSLKYIPYNTGGTGYYATWDKWQVGTWNPDDLTLNPEDVEQWTVGSILNIQYADNYENKPDFTVLGRIQSLTVEDVTRLYFTLNTNDAPIKVNELSDINIIVEVTSVRNPSFPDSSDMLAGVLNEADKMVALDELYETWNSYRSNYIDLKPQYDNKIAERAVLISGEGTDNLEYWQTLKTNLIQAFETKYSRFIIEGTWTDSNYTNADSYYLDALKVAQTSGKPKISYTLNASDLSTLLGYELFKFAPGDVTYIQDPEYFGYDSKGTPYKEKVVISKIKYDLLNPSNNQITLQNYMTQFEDLFQRISASVQSYNFNQNMYSRAGNFSATSLNQRILQNTLLGHNFTLLQSPDKSITIDSKGIYLIDAGNNMNHMRIMSNGIILSSDGGRSWNNGLTAQGLTADLITSGTINTSKINLFGGANAPGFSWDIRGINAFAYTRDQQDNIVIDYSKFIRFDQYGLYLASLTDGQTSENFDTGLANSPDPISWIQDRTNLSITWRGFYMKTEEGSVIIDPVKDIQVLSGAGSDRKEKVRIGWYPLVMDDEEGDGGYGIAVRDTDEDLIFHCGIGTTSAIYMPKLTNATGTENLVFIGSDGRLYKSDITYSQVLAKM